MSDWADEAAKEVVALIWRDADARDKIAEILRETWRQGRVAGFQRGQQSVIDFHKVVRDAAMGKQP